MINRLSYFLFAVVLLSSCSSSTVGEKREVKQTYKPNLLKFPFLFIPEENNLSFPLWFNDSIIGADQITKIERKTYVFDLEDSVNILKPSIVNLTEQKVYLFNAAGRVKNMRFSYFFDGEPIGHLAFRYSPESSVKGYCFAQNLDTTKLTDLSFGLKNELQVKQHQIQNNSGRFLSFNTLNEQHNLFYLPNPAYWGALTIHSTLHPHPEDKIILGSPTKPVKSYNVRNKVLQKNVMRFHYAKGTTVLKKMTWDDFPFSTVRTFLFDKKGTCKGFIDSLFSGNDYLKRTIATIRYNTKNLPSKILFKHELKQGEQRLGRLEVFSYRRRD